MAGPPSGTLTMLFSDVESSTELLNRLATASSRRQVEVLAAECGRPSVSKRRRLDERSNETYRLVVLFLAYTGVRFGELAALRVRRLDLDRRRATIAQPVTVVQGEGLVWGTPKTHGRREVPIPRFLAEDLAGYLAGKAPDDLVFNGIRGGGPLRVAVFRHAGSTPRRE